jgi:nuclear pore complex protein Nup88
LPQTQDNYGVDSCSILALPTLPPTLVMAEATGKMHHALLLEVEDVHDTSFNEVDSTLMYWAPEWELHVIETVELELGMVENRARSKGFTCPIFLKR